MNTVSIGSELVRNCRGVEPIECSRMALSSLLTIGHRSRSPLRPPRSRKSRTTCIVDEVSSLLCRHVCPSRGPEPGWLVSYSYRDEVLNLRRIEHFTHPSRLKWWQVHVRGYNCSGDTELTAHFEPEPRRQPRAHITLFGLDVDRGMETLLELLKCGRVNYDWLNDPTEL